MITMHADTTSYLFTLHRKELTRYVFDDFFYHPHFHPVRTRSGHRMTMDLPGDHPWHNGMYFSWKYLNGHNVWDRDFSSSRWGEPVHRTIQPMTVSGSTGMALRHDIAWVSDKGRELATESRILTVGAVLEDDAYSIDWTVTLTPSVDPLVLEREPDWGGYAGMMVRLIRCISPEITNSAGEKNISEENATLADWMDYRFWVDGYESRTHFERWAGITMTGHPQNVRHPAPFRCYFVKNIHGLHSPVLRDEPVTLVGRRSIQFAHRNVIYDGQPGLGRVQDWYERFARTPQPEVE